jgi:hypothetical protein
MLRKYLVDKRAAATSSIADVIDEDEDDEPGSGEEEVKDQEVL